MPDPSRSSWATVAATGGPRRAGRAATRGADVPVLRHGLRASPVPDDQRRLHGGEWFVRAINVKMPSGGHFVGCPDCGERETFQGRRLRYDRSWLRGCDDRHALPAACQGCRPQDGQFLSFCQLHGACIGCKPGDGRYDRMCPIHGVIADDQRAARPGARRNPGRRSP